MSEPADRCYVAACRRKATTMAKFCDRVTGRPFWISVCDHHHEVNR